MIVTPKTEFQRLPIVVPHDSIHVVHRDLAILRIIDRAINLESGARIYLRAYFLKHPDEYTSALRRHLAL